MHVKKITAVNMQQALRLVKKELGPDAIIISTRDIDPIYNNGKRHTVEITAAIDTNNDNNVSIMSANKNEKAYDDIVGIKKIVDPLQKEIAELKETIKSISPNLIDTRDNGSLKKELNELKSVLYRLFNNNHVLKDLGIHDFLIDFYSEAVNRDINERLAFGLIEKVNRQITKETAISEENIKARFFNEMMRFVKTSGPIVTGLGKPKVVAFIGSTGVGKTTTIAKLAAEFSLNQKKDVALLTLDTYRIAAVEQLKIYGRILGIPVFVARDKPEFREVMELYKNKDIVLIDTAGRSRKDKNQIKELMSYLDGDIQVEIHLVLSSIDQEEVIFDNIKRFHSLSVDRLIFSKLDEANSFGKLFNIAMKTNKPISYFTTGQKVPEDIETATPEKTIDLIFQ